MNKRFYETFSVVPNFNEIMLKENYAKVDPIDCISFVDYCGRSLIGICGLMHIFDKNMLFNSDIERRTAGTAACGLSLGSGTPLLVKLEGSFKTYVKMYFQEQLMTESELQTNIETREDGYGIIECSHLHREIVKIISIYERSK